MKLLVYCPFCGGIATLRDNKVLYGGRGFGKSYICENYPVCNSYVGTHKGTDKPLGTVADAELRALRGRCHAELDPIWKNGAMSRKRAYKWLSEIMGLKDAHIAEFTKEQCRLFLKKRRGEISQEEAHRIASLIGWKKTFERLISECKRLKDALREIEEHPEDAVIIAKKILEEDL